MAIHRFVPPGPISLAQPISRWFGMIRPPRSVGRTAPRRHITSRQFEDEVGTILSGHFPCGVISRVPVFNANSREEFLFANEADHLVHFRKDGKAPSR